MCIIEFLIKRISHVTYVNLPPALHLHSLSNCNAINGMHIFIYDSLYIYTSIYVVQYLHTTRYSHLLKTTRIVFACESLTLGALNYTSRKPELPLATTQMHNIQLTRPPPRTPPTQEKDGTARQALHMQTNYMQHTHTHAHSARERSEARNFLCHHIANGLC